MGAARHDGWWVRETSRQLVATPPALLGLLVPGHVLVKVIVVWDIFAVLYLGLTWLAFRRQPTEAVYEIARRTTPRGGSRHLTAPPDQLSQSAAMFALVVAAIALPRADELDAPDVLVFVVSGLAIVSAWLILQVGFTLLYLSMHVEHGGFVFPNTDQPRLVDFAYLAVAVGTSFGTSDVSLTGSHVRRQVMVHSVLAFVFNTVILAAVVALIVQYAS